MHAGYGLHVVLTRVRDRVGGVGGALRVGGDDGGDGSHGLYGGHGVNGECGGSWGGSDRLDGRHLTRLLRLGVGGQTGLAVACLRG